MTAFKFFAIMIIIITMIDPSLGKECFYFLIVETFDALTHAYDYFFFLLKLKNILKTS